uniref:Uncharacterized protein n=1 Tax=Anguilla anguilla TaxID=7936 RepID=A0A0E9RMJ7_ANGAN
MLHCCIGVFAFCVLLKWLYLQFSIA